MLTKITLLLLSLTSIGLSVVCVRQANEISDIKSQLRQQATLVELLLRSIKIYERAGADQKHSYRHPPS